MKKRVPLRFHSDHTHTITTFTRFHLFHSISCTYVYHSLHLTSFRAPCAFQTFRNRSRQHRRHGDTPTTTLILRLFIIDTLNMFMEYSCFGTNMVMILFILYCLSPSMGNQAVHGWTQSMEFIGQEGRKTKMDNQIVFSGRKQSIVGNYCCNVNLGTFW